jgi:hypothetical protein
VAANYATSAQDHFDTDSEIKKQAEADAYALTEGMNKSAMQVVEDGRARVRLLAEIQKTQRAIYNTPGAEGNGPISSSDRMNSLAEKVASHEISVADAQALLNRQQQYNGDIHVGKAGTQAAADLAASQDTAVAAIGHMEADAGQGAYNAVTDVQGKTTAGVAVRLAAGYLTDGASTSPQISPSRPMRIWMPEIAQPALSQALSSAKVLTRLHRRQSCTPAAQHSKARPTRSG